MLSIREFKNLFVAEVKNEYRSLKSYPLDFFGNILVMLLTFSAAILGINKFGSVYQLIGVIYLPLLMTLIGTPLSTIRTDVQLGIFEQIYNSKFEIHEIVFVRTVVSFITSLPISLVLLFIASYSNPAFSITFVELSIALTAIFISGMSIGFIFSGFGMIYRKLDSILNLTQLILMGIVVLPMIKYIGSYLNIFIVMMPIGGIIAYLQMITSDLEVLNILKYLTLNLFVWLGISRYIYNRCVNKARKLGTLGAY